MADPMSTWLELNFPVKVVRDTSKGRCLIAAENLAPGSIVMVPSDKLLRCSNCKVKLYCCAQCQKDDWLEHKAECKHISSIAGLQPEDQVKLLLLCRLQTGRYLRQRDAPMAGKIYSHTAEDCLTLEPPSFPSGSPEASMFEHQTRVYDSLINLAIERGLLRVSEELDEDGERAGLFTREGLLRLMLSFDSNNFFTFDELMTGRAASVYPTAAILNHSCVPNCALWYAPLAEAQAHVAGRTFSAQERSSLAPPQRAPRVLVIRTLCAVKAGEELCHAYTDAAVTREQRQAHLMASYGFLCTCAACTAPQGSAMAAERFQLACADGKRIAAVGVPTPYADPSEDEANKAPTAHGLPSADNAVHDDWSTLEEKEVAIVKRARDALNMFRKLPLLFARGPQGRPALEACTIKLHRLRLDLVAEFQHLVHLKASDTLRAKDKDEELLFDNVLILNAEQTGRFENGEAGFELIGVRCLEWCLLALQTVLHPLHVQVMQIINQLHGSYIVFQDYQALAAATEHILASQRHCYGVHSGEGGGRVHPMVSLQLYQQADALAELVEWARPDVTMSSQSDRVTKKLFTVPPMRAALLQAIYVRYVPPSTTSDGSFVVPYVYIDRVEAIQRTLGLEAVEHFGQRCAAAFEEIHAITGVCQGKDSEMCLDTAEKAVQIRVKVQRIKGILSNSSRADSLR